MKRFLTDVLKFALAAAVTFAGVETYFRSSEISLPSFIVDDAQVGRRFVPNAPSILLQEGFYLGRVNRFGYLGPAYPPDRSVDALRVALVGDSYVEAFHVFDRSSFRSVLERSLSARIGRRVETLNFGRSGQDLRTMYAYFEAEVSKFTPDVALFVLSASDLVEKDAALGPECYLDGDTLKISHAFARSDAFRFKLRLAFARKFGVYQMVQNALYRYRRGETGRIVLDKLYGRIRRARGGTLPQGGHEGYDEDEFAARDRYRDLNRAVIGALGRLHRSGRVRVVIVAQDLLPEYYVRVMRDVGLPVFDLAGALRGYEASGANPYYWAATNQYGHWNHEAHDWIGKYLAKRLEQALRDGW